MSNDPSSTDTVPRDQFRCRRPARQIPRGTRQAHALRRQPAVRRGQGRLQPLCRRSLRRARLHPRAADRRGRGGDHRRRLRRPAGGARGCARRGSKTSASSRRAATSAAPGTGTAIRARSATSRATSTCRCSKRPATSPRRTTPSRRRSSSTRSASAEHYDLYRDACFQTQVKELRWDEDEQPLDRHHQPRRRYAGALRGHVQRPAEPAEAARHPRHRELQGPHLPHQPLGLRLHRRRHHRETCTSWPTSASAIIGTGATAMQCVPHLGAIRQATLRLPAHAVVGRCARQPADRSGLGRRS